MESKVTSDVCRQYQAAFQRYGRNDLRSLFTPKGQLREKEKFGALTAWIKKEPFSILDYGCGLGHLKAFLDGRFRNFDYTGVDIVPELIQDNVRHFGCGHFLPIQSYREISNTYDFVVSSHVFNMLYFDEAERHKEYVFGALAHLFSKTRIAMSVDFMTTEVDYRQEGAYHQDVDEIRQFVRTNLTKRLVIDQSYLAFEFVVTAFKDDEVLQPSLTYRPLATS